MKKNVMKKTSLAALLGLSILAGATLVQAETAPESQATLDPVVVQAKARSPENRGQGAERGNRMAENRPHDERPEPFMFGGFMPTKTTQVADAEKWQDDQPIILIGHIVKQVGKNDFVFKDSSGELTLEINRKAMRGLITPEDNVKIVAEVEKSWGKTEVEAVVVEKVRAVRPQQGERVGKGE
ncbi:YgiW/YdeI family stress tolerance OB fold protein [Lonepinella sp. BR2271]|uniref:YgiW/YdeI family stress tolerance OB fold protein n=1 Tax=Lonepinella sp. BR2271 TaxID=3434550 RepID=UPI003F6E0B54